LVALQKAKKKLITQKQAAQELRITERHVRRLLRELKRCGDKVVAHGLRGLPSNREISADTEKEAVAILSRAVNLGFGPTLASEYLTQKHGIDVSLHARRSGSAQRRVIARLMASRYSAHLPARLTRRAARRARCARDAPTRPHPVPGGAAIGRHDGGARIDGSGQLSRGRYNRAQGALRSTLFLAPDRTKAEMATIIQVVSVNGVSPGINRSRSARRPTSGCTVTQEL
jgi:hypothetical protein